MGNLGKGLGVIVFFVLLFLGVFLISFLGIYSILLILLGIVIAWLLSGFTIIKEWERIVILRLGKFTSVRGPGVTYYISGYEGIANTIDLRTQTYRFSAEKTLTKDNVPVDVDAIVFYRVVSSKDATLNVENFARAAQMACQTSLREVMGQRVLDELLMHREKIASHIQDIIDEKTEAWGVKVSGVEIRDITVPKDLQDEIVSQARAERERRARVIHAQAEVQAAEKMLEAAKKYGSNRTAFSLRWMNILHEIGREQNTTMLIPSSFPVQLEAGKSLAEALKGVASEEKS